jgi:hypothetical protein
MLENPIYEAAKKLGIEACSVYHDTFVGTSIRGDNCIYLELTEIPNLRFPEEYEGFPLRVIKSERPTIASG